MVGKQRYLNPNGPEAIAASLERCANKLDGVAANRKGKLPEIERLLSENAARIRVVARKVRKGEMGVQVGKVIARTARLLHRSARLFPFPIAFSSGAHESTQGSGRQRQKR
jgi:hypothetical protein